MIATAPTNFAYTDKLPPANIEAEELILGGILLDGRAINTVSNILSPESFSIVPHYHIYKAFLSMTEEKIPIDMMTATAWLADHKLLEAVGGQSKIAQLVERTVSVANIDSYAEIIHEKYLRRQLMEAGSRLRELAYTDDFSSAITEGESLLCQIERMQRGNPKNRLIEEVKAIREIESPVDQWFAWDQLAKRTRHRKKALIELAIAAESDSELESYSAQEFINLESADSPYLIHGLLKKGAVSMLAAEAKTGKTLLVNDAVHHVARGESWGSFLVDRPHKTLIVQTDEPRVETQERLICRGLVELDNVEVMPKFSCHQLSRLKKKIKTEGFEFVVLDSLTSINMGSGYSPNDAEYGYFVYQLKDLAEETGCSILLIHHTNKRDLEAGLEKIAGSAVIIRACSDIFLLSRSKQSSDPDTARVLFHAAGRSSGQRLWKLNLDVEDFSWEFEGHCNADGSVNEKADENEKQEQTQSLKIQEFLKSEGKAFEPREIAHQLAIAAPNTRKICGNLARQGRIGRRRSSSGQGFVYFWQGDPLITAPYIPCDPLNAPGDPSPSKDRPKDRPLDRLSNPHPEGDSAKGDPAILKNSAKKISTDNEREIFSAKKGDPLDRLTPKPSPSKDLGGDPLGDPLGDPSPSKDRLDRLRYKEWLSRFIDDPTESADRPDQEFKVGDRIIANWPQAKKAKGVITEITSNGKLVITWDTGEKGLVSPGAALHESAIASWMPECSTPTEALGIKARLFTSPKLHALPWFPEELGRSTWIDLESGRSEDWEAVRDRLESHPFCRVDHLPEEYQILWFDWAASKE